jgi:hypothetical protein
MLRQLSRQGRVDAMIKDGLPDDDALSTGLTEILQEKKKPADYAPSPVSPAEVAAILKNALILPLEQYTALLQYLQFTGRQYRNYRQLPHPPNSLILPPRAELPLQMHRGDRTFSCQKSHEGNSAIQFYNPYSREYDTGFIEIIWRIPLEDALETFLVVRPHRRLPFLSEAEAPFQQYPGFLTKIVDAAPLGDDALQIIEPTHIITHLTTFRRPERTYSIPQKTLVICWALNRGRR